MLVNQWDSILRSFHQIHLNDGIIGSLSSNKVFSIKFFYEYLEKDLSSPNNKMICKSKNPLKIQIFMRQTFSNANSTRDNKRRHTWLGYPT
jgi:hypothetical protein